MRVRAGLVVPKPPPKGAFNRAAEWLNPSSWLLNTTVILHFVCPVTCTAVGEGFELSLPKDWVVKYGPAMRVGLAVLSLGIGVARSAGWLPLPQLSADTGHPLSTLDAQTYYLHQLCTSLSKRLDTENMGYVNKYATDVLESAKGTSASSQSEQLRSTVRQSYADVRVLLDNVAPRSPGSWENKVHDPQRCGLTKAVCAADGSYEWVEPRWRESYERRGRALLGDGAAEA